MSNSYVRNNDTNLLHPNVRVAVLKIENTLKGEDIPLRIFEAFRFPQRQADLYAQGRTKPGGIVTYAQPWHSYHQYGLAVDFVLFVNGQWSWDDSTPAKKQWWKRMHELGKDNGLTPLGFETPHLQISETSSNALIHGHYPPGGDDSWSENLASAIDNWHSSPSAPPSPTIPRRPSLPKKYIVTAQSGLNLREGAGTTFNIKSELQLGQIVYVTTIENGWAQVSISGNGDVDGFASISFLDKI